MNRSNWRTSTSIRALPIACFVLSAFGAIALPATVGAQDKPPAKTVLHALQDAFASVAEEVEPAVVTITARKTVRPVLGTPSLEEGDDPLRGTPLGRGRSSRPFRALGTGSGVIISTEGWILTNDHVIGGAEKVTVRLIDGREFEGTVRRDFRSDLALIKIEGSNLRAARLGDSDKVKIGHWAIAIGSPFRYEGTFSVGVVSSLFRRQEIRSSTGVSRVYPSMIQTDAAINPGNSGGPLLNLDGEVIGINTAIESDSGGSVGIGFAIPINAARFVADQLKTSGKVVYGYLGIDPGTVTPRLASAYQVSNGALVQGDPSEESPAAKAGLQADDVITEIEGKPVRNELDLRTIVSRIRPGTTIAIVYVRNGTEKKTTATIAEAPTLIDEGVTGATPGKVNLGIEVASISPDSLKKIGLDEKIQGVTIKSLDSGSPVSESEMEKGDIILKVNDHPTPNVEAFKKATSSANPGNVLRVLWTGKRGKATVKRVAIVIVD